MSDQLERILPVLSLIPGVNIAAGFLQSVYIAASQRKIGQLERALKYEVGLLNQKLAAGKVNLDSEYIRSDAFESNVMQALRAIEISDSSRKIEYIAKALLGCSIKFDILDINKTICMRIIEQISTDEIDFLISRLKIPKTVGDISKQHLAGSFPESHETMHLSKGLLQLGVLEISVSRLGASPLVRTSILAEHIASLCLNKDQITTDDAPTSPL